MSIYIDLTGDEWFYADAVAAREMGLLSGYPDGSFGPHRALIRSEAASIIRRLADALLEIESLKTARLVDKLEPLVASVSCFDATGQLISRGSAVWVGGGYAVTNAHVVAGASRVSVIWPKVMDWPAVVLAAQGDLALLFVERMVTVPGAVLADSTRLQAGTTVFSVGNALGAGIRIAKGQVARDDAFPLMYEVGQDTASVAAIDHTGSISPGNSGGGLFDVQARLVGITNAGIPGAGDMYFAIPVEDVRAFLTAQGVVA